MDLWLDVDVFLCQCLDVCICKQFAILFDNGHSAVVSAQKRQKLDIMLARLCHVGKNYAVVVLWNDGNFDGCYRCRQCLGKLFQSHKAVAHDGFRLKEHLLELFHSLICNIGLDCVARQLLLLRQDVVALGNLLTCQKVAD